MRPFLIVINSAALLLGLYWFHYAVTRYSPQSTEIAASALFLVSAVGNLIYVVTVKNDFRAAKERAARFKRAWSESGRND